MDSVGNLRDYLRGICLSVLQIGNNGAANVLDDSLNSPETLNCFNKFANSPDTFVLYCEYNGSEVSFSLDVRMTVATKILSSFALFKSKEGILDSTKPVAFQVQIVSLAAEREGDREEVTRSFYANLQQVTKCVYMPVTKATRTNFVEGREDNEDENFVALQKKLRELDAALELCQRGSAIPSIIIGVPEILANAVKTTPAATIKNFIDNFNQGRVEQFLVDLSLSEIMDVKKEEFEKELNATTKMWPIEIKRQIQLTQSQFSGNVEKEINFWREFDRKLNDTRDQLDSPPVLLTRLVLRKTNRVSEGLMVEAESNLKKAMETVSNSLSFLKDLASPYEELITATSLHPKLSKSAGACLQHFQKLKHSQYDFTRSTKLLEVLYNVVHTRILVLLREKNMMQCSIEDLRVVNHHADEAFRSWKTNLTTMRQVLRTVAKQKGEKFEFKSDFEQLHIKVTQIVKFREEHDKLINILGSVLVGSDNKYVQDLSEGFDIVVKLNPDIFDLSPAGNSNWSNAQVLYEKRLEKVEEHVTRILKERLGSAKSADEMFRIFSTFNPLFFRASIKDAVQSFRSLLVKNVNDDVQRLQEKFRRRYDESLERVTADLRDIPPLSGRIMWARQIENQLAALMARIQDVLGVGWEDHMEGKQLKESCDVFTSFLDINQMYDEWVRNNINVDTKYSKLKDFLLLIEEDPKLKAKFIKVNFDEKLVVVFKEVKYLEWLLPTIPNVNNKTIPNTIRSRSGEAYQKYPVALALQSALVVFNQSKRKINPENSILLNSTVNSVREIIKEALGGSAAKRTFVKWDSKNLNDWVSHLSNKVFALQERVDDVTDKMIAVDELLKQLSKCKFNYESMREVIESLQVIVDELPMKGLSNIPVWVKRLDKRIEAVLKDRLIGSIEQWVVAFNNEPLDVKDGSGNQSQSTPLKKHPHSVKDTPTRASMVVDLEEEPSEEQKAETVELEKIVELESITHEILIANQILYLSPPIEYAKSHWISEFHKYIATACILPRIVPSRFKAFAEVEIGPQDYSNILTMLDGNALKQPYLAIDKKVTEAKAYAQQWLQYQALWDASVVVIADRLGRNIPMWQQLLKEIKSARTTVDTEKDEMQFGQVVINHKQVQNKINLKYDTWQTESQLKFGSILLEDIKSTQAELINNKTRLETLSLEGPTKDVIIAVDFILKTKAAQDALSKSVEELKKSEKLLQSQRFKFPPEWVPVSNLQGTYHDMCEILDRRTSAMETQLPALQQKINEEAGTISNRTEAFLKLWQNKKPVDGSLDPVTVLEEIADFVSQVSKLQEETQRIKVAKESLGLEYISDDRLGYVEAEINDLREAWVAVAPVNQKLIELKGALMKDIDPAKLKKQVESLADELKTLPAKVRSYAAVEGMNEKLNKYLATFGLLRDLSTEAMKDRHWKKLLERMDIYHTYANVTIGIMWDSNLINHKKTIYEVLAIAQGEMALEVFLRELRESWVLQELQVVLRDGVKIIVGWENLFTPVDDHLSQLTSLKQSPFFKNVPEFQEDTINWENRLSTLRVIFDGWLEVQRKWLYLKGIFKNKDIQDQLPQQNQKFKSLDNEYLALIKKVADNPRVLELLKIENLTTKLEKQNHAMEQIQKALGEYLDKQRQIFPRFYFVNNDDLVEIIGNGNEPNKIFVHLSKMFQALSGVTTIIKGEVTKKSNGMWATEMCSREGESVVLSNPVDLSVNVKDWLMALDQQMAATLAALLQGAVMEMTTDDKLIIKWIEKFPAQITIMASLVAWNADIEKALSNPVAKINDGLNEVLSGLMKQLKGLAVSVLQDLAPELRKKLEQLLTEMVHQRDVTRLLLTGKITGRNDFGWLYHLRYYFDSKQTPMRSLCVKMSNAVFYYGFEYFGISERLVQTPLTDRCYLTLTQALHFRMGGNPFGPAGTGKTESVKMLGSQLGRFTLVFNCDASFDYAAMGRIFSGLCQVGAWGCFDEFNRLVENMLSAVSQQILTIQKGLANDLAEIDMLGNRCKLSKNVGIFITMNPGYAGRSNLPENLKQLFRAVAMAVPDKKLIAQVMLFSQGIVTAEDLAGKIVLLFTLCQEQLSLQPHYDFGLRALKSVLVGGGELKRKAIMEGNGADRGEENISELESTVLIKATCDSIVPKLVSEDIHLFTSLLQAVFIGSEIPTANEEELIKALKSVCEEDSFEFSDAWAEKVLQLKQVLDVRHGVMLVGPTGTGKTAAWKILLKALERVDGKRGEVYVIDPKAITLTQLYGNLDPNTLEWTDGVFTSILRKVSDTTSGKTKARSWIMFDGDVDPDWAENLNSVLDDNKVLTLPSGDRIKIPNNVRIMIEVDTLKYATLATVSRAGMIWFPKGTVTVDMVLRQQLRNLRKDSVFVIDPTDFLTAGEAVHKHVQNKFVDSITSNFTYDGLIGKAIQVSQSLPHVMDPETGRLLNTLYTMLLHGIAISLDYSDKNSETPMSDEHIQKFSTKWLLFSVLWAFGGSMTNDRRLVLCQVVADSAVDVELPPGDKSKLFDMQANVEGDWIEWSSYVTVRDLEPHQVSGGDIVIQTTDTTRHVEVMKSWLMAHKPLILCGPPGSGKSMSLTSVLNSAPEYVLAALNFSSGTTPELIMKTFEQYCEVVDGPKGLTLLPNRQTYADNQWLVIFMDECNLPEQDAYATQAVIMFVRQLVEQGGYWNTECKWVKLHRIQFVGACNPPTDAGRVPMSERFMRHAPLLLVDYPSEESFKQIYRTFNNAMLKLHPNLRDFVDPLNNAMVEFYLKNQRHFNADMQPQYIYSPRELSRWIRALYETISNMEAMTGEELVRLWAHEALRLFSDRLVTADEREWLDKELDATADKNFGGTGVDMAKCLERPMLYSVWIKKTYESVDRETLRTFLQARLKVFYEEQLDVPLVIFDEVLDHVLRIDNVLKNPMGHLLLCGESGTGKTVLTKLVAWMNGLSLFQIKANNKYTVETFFEDLRALFRRVGVDGEKICFIFDESNALSTAFMESMNALLASGEVPGLFEGDDRAQLLNALKEKFLQKEGILIDSPDELTRRFTKIIQKNLHVVFTMNPAGSDFSGRCSTSPALFNRCVVDWFGTWSPSALAQVGLEFTSKIDTGFTQFNADKASSENLSMVMSACKRNEVTLSEAIVAALVSIHEGAKRMCTKMGKSGRNHYLSPRDYLDLIAKFVDTFNEQRDVLQEQQRDIKNGLRKLNDTQDQVEAMSAEMAVKGVVLKDKEAEGERKVTQMIESQGVAEKRKVEAEKLSVEIADKKVYIDSRRSAVEEKLATAEPTLAAAKAAVGGIRKKELDEVRGLAKPPEKIRLTMEIVVTLMGQKDTDWSAIQKFSRKETFIQDVIQFDATKLSEKVINNVEKLLLNPNLDFDSVNRASSACGPLYKWSSSVVEYAKIVQNIKPMREELENLQRESDALTAKLNELNNELEGLETAIKQYKVDYANSVKETQNIKQEMESVSKKVLRAQSLLKSLEKEKVRWDATSEGFDLQMATLIGDNLLAGAFLTYGGIFDHKIRKSLLQEWSDVLEALAIPFRPDIDMIAHLSNATEQVQWRDWGLPTDELAVQNAILLQRYRRYPLIIDPSGQASAFIMKKYEAEKIQMTSFLDTNFGKSLSTAIRFGKPLLVNDVESIDPILNPVLNKETQKTGGRTLIRIGTEDIDFSPSFMIVLVTRNPLARFPPDLCSRITCVNFTVTPASLEAQTLSAVLKSERPDVDQKRSEVIKMQGEQAAKVRELQATVLNKISSVQGNILDDDSVIDTLEKIQKQAAQLNEEVEKTRIFMEEIKEVSNSYTPLAVSIASTYFSLEGLCEVYFLYHFSLAFFFEIVAKVLKMKSDTNASNDPKENQKRLKWLKDAFFREVARRVLRGLRFEDKLMFVFRLAQIMVQGQSHMDLTSSEYNLFLQGSAPLMDSALLMQKFKDTLPDNMISDGTARQLISLSLLPAFSDIQSSLGGSDRGKWIKFFEDGEAEKYVPMDFVKDWKSLTNERKSLLRILVVRCLRPDRVMFAMESFITCAFGEDFDWREISKIDLKAIVEIDSRSTVPLMLCSDAGQDASSKVDELATKMDQKLLQVSMGSAEGFKNADTSIAQAVKSGAWVLLRNVHLCPEWLSLLEKRFHTLGAHQNFRLFLTCEIHPKLPSSLMRASEVLIFEASTGIKANIQRFYNSIPKERIDRQPSERVRLYGLLAWFNAVVQERLRYVPVGWTKRHEFSEADTACSLNVIDQWVDEVAQGRAHVDPADLPWTAIQKLLSECLYGGRVDDPFDQIALDSFITSVFDKKNYNPNAVLATDHEGAPLVKLPDGLSRQAFEQWIKELPDTNSPGWIGLPVTAESQLRLALSQRILANLNQLQGSNDDSTGSSGSSGKSNDPMQVLQDSVNQWLSVVPSLDSLPMVDAASTSDASSLPLDRCLAREVIKGRSVISLVVGDLELLNSFCKGEVKVTNHIRELMSRFAKGSLPKHWRAEYAVNAAISLSDWVVDLSARSKSLDRYIPVLAKDESSCVFWPGGMFQPETFIMATRQQCAQVNKWSLEDLELFLEIGVNTAESAQDYVVMGLTMEGAKFSNNTLLLSDESTYRLPESRLKWRLKQERPKNVSFLSFPIYLNETRKPLVSKVLIETPTTLPKEVWSQRGVALILQSSS
eukprot:gene4455-6300_t